MTKKGKCNRTITHYPLKYWEERRRGKNLQHSISKKCKERRGDFFSYREKAMGKVKEETRKDSSISRGEKRVMMRLLQETTRGLSKGGVAWPYGAGNRRKRGELAGRERGIFQEGGEKNFSCEG